MDKAIFETHNYQTDNFIRSLLAGKLEFSDNEIEQRKQTLNLNWLNGPFIVATAAPTYRGVSFANKDTALIEYENFINQSLKSFPAQSFTLLNERNNINILLCFNGSTPDIDQINTFFINLHDRLTERFESDVFIGIGSIAEEYKKLAVSSSDAESMLNFKYQYSDRGVVNIATMVRFQYNTSIGNNVEFDRVIGCFRDGNLGKMEVRLNELVESVRHRHRVSNTSIRRSLVEITVYILHTASNAGIDVEQVLNGVDPYRWIMQQGHTEVITEWIMKTSSKLLELMREKQKTQEKAVISQAKQYIEENLSHIELGLSQVSREVGLSETYFSQLFKQETGIGISAYITERRIASAKLLLTQTEMTGQEISRQVGFMSAGYFTQVFRKITGVSPGEYRKIEQKNDKN